jgi:hypothetical protein
MTETETNGHNSELLLEAPHTYTYEFKQLKLLALFHFNF